MFSLYARIYSGLKYLKDGTGDETNGRHLIAPKLLKVLGILHPHAFSTLEQVTEQIWSSIERQIGANKPKLFAIESFPTSIEILRQRGINVTSVDIERQRLPYGDQVFDAVLCNQVLEHVKEISGSSLN